MNALFALNRRILKAYLLKESLSQLWNYTYEGAMLRYLQSWIDQLRWQRLKSMDDTGIDVQVLSVAGAGPDLVPGADCIALA